MAHDLPVLAGARLALVGIDHQVLGPAVRRLRHEGPLQAGGKAGAAAASQATGLDLVDDPLAALEDDLLRFVPVALRRRIEN